MPVWDFYKPDRSLYERIIAELCVVQGEVGFDKAWAEGRAMTLEEATEYALFDDEKPVPLTSLYRSKHRPVRTHLNSPAAMRRSLPW